MKYLIGFIFSIGILINSAFATTYASDGTIANINTLIAAASAGDTITVPASTFTWGASGAQINLNKAVHLTGLGTTINFSASSVTQNNAIIVMTGNGGWVDGTWTMTGLYVGPAAVTPISWSGTNFVVTGITYTSSVTLGGYFIYISEGTGVCYNCNITAAGPSLQTFMIRGSNSRWNAANTMGTSNQAFIEDCTISSDYAQENDGAAAATVRMCTLVNGPSLDMHQFETSSSAEGTQHGSRQLEGYNNIYTTQVSGPQWLNARAGAGMIFDNIVPTTGVGGAHYFALVFEYGAKTGVPINGVSGTIATPAQSPIADQLGIGPYVTGVQTAGVEPFYYFNNAQADGSDMPLQGYNPQSSAAITQYGSTFYATSEDGAPYMYLRGREYFRGQIGGAFPSVSDVGYGTTAQMNASSPTTAGQGWWATDAGTWYQKWTGAKAATAIVAGDRCQIATVGSTSFTSIGASSNTVGTVFIAQASGSGTGTVTPVSGKLYRWSGSAWASYYEPYTYPHPLRGAVTTTASSALSGRVVLNGKITIK